MKKLIALIVAVSILLASLAFAEQPETFGSLTGLSEAARKLKDGITIDKIYYTEGNGFSVAEFSTTDPTEIRSLWNSLAFGEISLGAEIDEWVTDWYPQIVFFLSDGTELCVSFNGRNLEANGKLYELEGTDAFWFITASLIERLQYKVPVRTLEPREAPEFNPENGEYDLKPVDTDKIDSENFFTAKLYQEDLYSVSDVKSLIHGDLLVVNGKTVTVDYITELEDGELEIIPVDVYDYIVMKEKAGTDCYYAVIDDWVATSFLTEVKVSLPLPDDFRFIYYVGGEEEERTADEFLAQIRESGIDFWNQYNTGISFTGGMVSEIIHSDYPGGPGDE